MESRLDCYCGNPKVIDDMGKCQCGRYTRWVVDCEICGYSHKLRSPEFCRALQSPEGFDSLDKNKFLSESIEIHSKNGN